MKNEQVETIYKNFAEFHLRLHLTEIRTKYLPKIIEDAATRRLKEHYKIYRQELNEKLVQLGRHDLIAVSELERIKKEYLDKFEVKTLMN
ncbi:MAG: hypothetical protein WKF87_18200 [Chryseolinea sp.]